MDSFKGPAATTVLDGSSVLLWDDLWLNKIPRLQYPHLFSFANCAKISISSAKNAEGPTDLFHLRLSTVAA